MSITKKARKSASSKSRKRNYPKGLVLPEREIRDLAGNLRIREAQRAALCLLIVDKAARAISDGKAENGELICASLRKSPSKKSAGRFAALSRRSSQPSSTAAKEYSRLV